MIRRATLADAGAICALRNDPLAKFWSGSPRDINADTHAVWFAHALACPWKHRVFVADHGGMVVGYGRIETVTETRVSFAVAEAWRGQGIGNEILEVMARDARVRECATLLAYVHPGNTPSLRAFARQGYALTETRTDRQGVLWQVVEKRLA